MAPCQSMMSDRHTGRVKMEAVQVSSPHLCSLLLECKQVYSAVTRSPSPSSIPRTALPSQTMGESCLSLSCNTGASDTLTLGLLKVSCCEGWIGGGGWGYPTMTTFTDRNRRNIPEWYVRSLSCTGQRSLARSESFARKICKLCRLFDLWKSLSLFLRCLCGDLMMKNASSKLPKLRLELFSFVCFTFYEVAWDRSTRSGKDSESCRWTWTWTWIWWDANSHYPSCSASEENSMIFKPVPVQRYSSSYSCGW